MKTILHYKNKNPQAKKHPELLDEGIVHSLCFLYMEAVRQNQPTLSYILHLTLDMVESALTPHNDLSQEIRTTLKQVSILKGFLQLDPLQQEYFLRAITDPSDPANS